MNLSALNSGLSQAANPVSAEINNLAGVLSRPSSGTQSGEDFAAFLRHQIASLQNPQRQELAGDNAPKLTDTPTNKTNKGVFEQQALRQAFHPGQYLHNKAPSSKGMGMLGPGGHYAKQLPAAKISPAHAHAELAKADHIDQQAAQSHAREAERAQQTNREQDKAASEQAQSVDSAKAAKTRAKAWAEQDGQALQSIALSPEVEIITVAQPATSEKSLTDFALAMGLDPTQVQALLGDAASADNASSTVAGFSLLTAGSNTMNSMGNTTPLNLPMDGQALSTNAVLAQPLPSAPDMATMADNAPRLTPEGMRVLAAGSATYFNLATDGQALPTQTVLAQPLPLAPDMAAMAQNAAQLPPEAMPLSPIGLQVQWSAASADLAADKQFNPLPNQSITAIAQAVEAPESVSTLAVLSMMDADLRPEDIDRLKNEFDKLSAIDDSTSSPHQGMADTGITNARSNANANATPAQALKNHPDMAQTFEKLSQKLATELASRMNDQLNAGEWKMKFALKPASLGLVDVQLEMRDGQLSAQFQTDNGLTQNLIQNGSTRLKEALAELGMNNAYVSVGQDNRQSSQGGSGQSASHQTAPDNRVTLGDNNVGQQETAPVTARHSNSALLDTFA
ncbi:MAG: flagellar hook-length control protein FliK [Betaproteobacteria bacterium]|nr:flagellar hook-length control protein FliK [Betaproteobacteria bacterium]